MRKSADENEDDQGSERVISPFGGPTCRKRMRSCVARCERWSGLVISEGGVGDAWGEEEGNINFEK